ncbi:MAG TPA: hypothetical protein VMU54_18290 [Planctomycetota bacterium]|nr:hypothetical protein [Planctomycetota bacterium]
MPRWTPILAVLLVASLLGNVLLAVRLSRSSGPSADSGIPFPATDHAAQAGTARELKESLLAERDLNRKLRARIELLETDKKVLALETPGAAGKTDKLAAFREKLRKLKKMMADPALKNGNGVEPDNMVELTETMMEFMKMSALRSKEPKTYAGYLQTFFEVALEGEGTSLSAGQSSALQSLLQGYGEDLSRVPAVPAGERLLQEIVLEGAAMGRVQALLTDPQRAALAKDNLESLASMNMLSTAYITKQDAANQIAQQWSSLYQLDASQLPQAKLAAQSYVDAIARLDSENKNGDPSFSKPGSPEAYSYREQLVRQQLAALTVLEASMTPDQVDRLRNQTMKELHIMDAGTGVQVTTPEK